MDMYHFDFEELNKAPENRPLFDEERTTRKGNVMRVQITHYAKEYGGDGDYKIAYQAELRNRDDGTPILDIKGNPRPYVTSGSYYVATETEAREAAERILSGDVSQTPENPRWLNPNFEPFEI